MVAKAQIIFSAKDETDFLVNKSDEFLSLLNKQLPNKRFNENDLKNFYKTYRQYDFRQRQ